MDAAQDFLRRQRDIARTPAADRPPFETILLKNASGADRSPFDVLGIDAPVFTPADSLETFTNGIALAGVTPAASHAGNFAVLVEPIQTGQIGRARILGACPVKVNVVTASDAFADVEAGVTSRLKSGAAGAARILWKESGTGEKWAVVKLGNPAGGASAIPVKLTASQGAGPYTGKEQVWTGSAWSDKPGAPEHLRSDNGPEFIAEAIKGWLGDCRVGTLFIDPGAPWENAYIESFTGKLRDGLLDREEWEPAGGEGAARAGRLGATAAGMEVVPLAQRTLRPLSG